MQFSVLMSLYFKERPEFLKESLESVFAQSKRANEVILVEDGPLTEELYKILDKYESEYKELKRVKLSKNQGLGQALNEGLKYCTNELVIRMDTDDICFPYRFEKQLSYMEEHPDIDICSSWIKEFEGSVDNVIAIKKVPETHEEISKYICKRNPLNHPAVMFRKSSVIKAGGYKHFPLFEDWYLWVRMKVNNAKFANIQEPLLHFRTSPEMFKRRGGLLYTVNSTKFQWKLHRLGMISPIQAIKSSALRGVIYLMPNTLRKLFYSKFLRS